MSEHVRIVVVGTSGHAGVAIDAIERSGGMEILGLVDSFRTAGESAYGYPVLGPESALTVASHDHGANTVFIAIGDNFQRMRIHERIRASHPGLRFATVIHPAASVSVRALLGPGVLVCAGAVVGPGAELGDGCIVNTGASLDHDSRMDPWSSLAPGVAAGGNIRLGTCSAVGIGATVSHGIAIGAHVVLGAGAVAVRNIPGYCVAYGVPARAMRPREAGEPYL